MKIFYIIDLLSKMGGAEKNLLQVVLGLKKKGHVPIVCCLKAGQLISVLQEAEIEVYDLNLHKIYGFKALKTIIKSVLLIKKRKIDLIITYHEGSDFFGLLLAAICQVPIISNRRDMGFNLKKRHFVIYKLINRYFDRIITVSNAVKKMIVEKQNVDPQKISVLYNGLNYSRFIINHDVKKKKEELGLTTSGAVVGCLANIRSIKGHEYFVKAAKKVLEQFPHTQFIIVGEYDLTDLSHYCHQLFDIVKNIGIEKSIIFTGARNDIPEILSIMDISVLASLSEGFSNTLLESMAAGKPVVATDVGGNSEAVLNDEVGILVTSADHQSLAQAIIALLKDKAKAESMGEAGIRRVKKKFSIDNMLASHEELYEYVVHKQKARVPWFLFKYIICKDFFIKGLKLFVAGILYYTGINTAYMWIKKIFGKSTLIILGYHNISNSFPTYLGISQSVDFFEKQIDFLKKNYSIVGLHEGIELLKKKKRSKKSVVITFDDCYKEFYTNIFPIAQREKIPVIFFITVNPIQSGFPLIVDSLIYAISNTDKLLLDMTSFKMKKYLIDTYCNKEKAVKEINEHLKSMEENEKQKTIMEIFKRLDVNFENIKKKNMILSWDDILIMKNNGMMFGAHTLTHPDLTKLPVEKAIKEIQNSKDIIENKIGAEILFFAYPYGGRENINNTIVGFVKAIGFKGAVTLQRNITGAVNPFLLPRLTISEPAVSCPGGKFSKSLFAIELSGLSKYAFCRFAKHSCPDSKSEMKNIF